MSAETPPRAISSSRSITPLKGAAARLGPERQVHDAVFDRLVDRTDFTWWSIFGEVPSPVGSIDILAISGPRVWRDLALRSAELTIRSIDGLSRLQRRRKYRESTLLERTGFSEADLEQLAELDILTLQAGLWMRSDLPSDHVRRLVVFEVKAAGFPGGAVQAGRRRTVATETWMVVPSVATAERLGSRTWDLVERCQIGMRNAELQVIHPTTRGKRPNPVVVNRMARAIYL